MTLQIVPLDGFDDEAVSAWHDVYVASSAERGPEADVRSVEEAQLELQHESESLRRLAWRGISDGRTVGYAWLTMPTKDNTHRASLALHVAPRFRRRGFGRQMLAHIEDVGGADGRTTFTTSIFWPYDNGAEGTGSPGVAFAKASGYAWALGEVRRQLELPVADGLLASLAAEAAAHHEGYEIRSFVGPIPDEHVVGWATLDALVDTDSPMGDLDIEPWSVDVGEVRETEALVESQGGLLVNTIALAPDGAVAAYSQMVVRRDRPRATQWGTLVRVDHRGHRLGTAIKVANLALLQQVRPDVENVRTYNAESNTHMTTVNDVLGFRPAERLGEFQKRLA